MFIESEAVLDHQRSQVDIAITTDLAARVAIALLATTARPRADREPALDVLGAAAVASGCADRVRVHLLFPNGAVLPFEMSVDAAATLRKSLGEALRQLWVENHADRPGQTGDAM